MRLIQTTPSGAAPISIPANAVSLVVINGPSYKFTSQTNIWRLLFAHAVMQLVSMDGSSAVVVSDASLHVIINPNTGADKRLLLPIKKGLQVGVGGFDGAGMAIADGGFSANGLPPANWTHDFDVDEVAIRGDDFPNLGGVQLIQGGSGGFSIALAFQYCIFYESFVTLQPLIFNHKFDVLTDLSDFSTAVV